MKTCPVCGNALRTRWLRLMSEAAARGEKLTQLY
jgi:hypothetical protein